MTKKPSITDRICAAEILGVPLGACREEIRTAWKKAAFEMHPDRGHGTAEQFAALSEAYSVLLETAPVAAPGAAKTPAPETPPLPDASVRKPARPTVKKRTEPIGGAAKARCMEILKALAVQGQVAVEARRTGRNVSYFFENPAEEGLNHVSVDAGNFIRRSKPVPVHVEVATKAGGAHTVELPQDTLAAAFPGVRRVRLHFGKSEETLSPSN